MPTRLPADDESIFETSAEINSLAQAIADQHDANISPTIVAAATNLYAAELIAAALDRIETVLDYKLSALINVTDAES